ncbi:MAG TPA: ABC transporter substrate-binding protein [Gemmatimonadales bacterium]|nr:ABC transporter substrate-binding protein [Gemmatimonadales bacterium]
MTRRLAPSALLALLAGCAAARGEERGATVMFASGADLQSINPLVTLHPLARQVQRYVLLTTLARYDDSLVARPYLARSWSWTPDRRRLTFVLQRGVRWHDGRPTTARDAAWTLEAARDPTVGYPRATELRDVAAVDAPDDSTLLVRFASPQAGLPDVLTDLAILPAHLLGTERRGRMRAAAWNAHPVGNGPFRFVRHEPNRRWVFAANPEFPAALGGPPSLERLVIAVVDEPVTKLAALVSGELDFAGIQPAHAEFVRRDPGLRVLDYPLLFTYGVVLNTRRPPFDRLDVRRAIAAALDRREIVDAHVYGFGEPAYGPVPPGLPGAVTVQPASVVTGRARSLPRRSRGSFELLTAGSGEGTLEQLIQAQLAAAGFEVRIRQLELSTFLSRLYGPAHDFDAAVLGIPGDPGLGYLGPLAALAGAPALADPAAAQRMFGDSAPVAFLYHARGVQGMNRRVLGVTMDLRGELATVHDWRVGR